MTRDPAIERMVENFKAPVRKSTRLMTRENVVQIPVKKIPQKRRRALSLPGPSPTQSNSNQKLPVTTVKPILKSAHRRPRSKSVSFDIDDNDSPNVGNGNSDLSTSSKANTGNDPIDLTIAGAKHANVPNVSALMRPMPFVPTVRNAQQQVPSTSYDRGSVVATLSSGEELAYKNRIDTLVQSNAAKINRINSSKRKMVHFVLELIA